MVPDFEIELGGKGAFFSISVSRYLWLMEGLSLQPKGFIGACPGNEQIRLPQVSWCIVVTKTFCIIPLGNVFLGLFYQKYMNLLKAFEQISRWATYISTVLKWRLTLYRAIKQIVGGEIFSYICKQVCVLAGWRCGVAGKAGFVEGAGVKSTCGPPKPCAVAVCLYR